MEKKTRFSLIYLIVAIFGVMLLHDAWVNSQKVAEIPYSEFQALLDQGKVSEVVLTPREIQGELKEPLNGKTRFVAIRVDPTVANELGKYGVPFRAREESPWVSELLAWFMPVLLFLGLWFLLAGRMKNSLGPGLMSIGKSRAKVFVETHTKVTFADVAGVDEAKAELVEIVEFLKDPKSHGRLGGRMPKGVLLVGPPGTGKTLLARAVAGEAGVPFFSISGSEFVEMFVGVGAARVRDLFEQARQAAPGIIFIDELDALGRARGAGAMMGGHDEKEQTLNQLLVELDGFDSRTGLVLLAATNRPEILDPALLRAGRFDRQVLVDRPDRRERVEILKVHLKKIKAARDVDVDAISALTPGFTGADLANLVNEAALAATRRAGDSVAMRDFNTAIERIVAGLEKRNRILTSHERRIVAHHEMGHALVAAAVSDTERVHKVSIIPRGVGALGYTIQRPTEERFLMTRGELEAKMAVLLGGRAAEVLMFDHLSTGASDDLAKSTEIARSMVVRYGMAEELGHVAFEPDPVSFLGPPTLVPRRPYSEETALEIDRAVSRLVEAAFRRAREVLERSRVTLEEAARLLLEKETLHEDDLARFFGEMRRSAARGEEAGEGEGGREESRGPKSLPLPAQA